MKVPLRKLWTLGGAALLSCFSGALAHRVRAELPPVFLEDRDGRRDRVFPDVWRPAQEVMEAIEDVTIWGVKAGIHFLDNIALQNRYMDGVQALLDGQLQENYFKQTSTNETDVVFLRQALSSLHLRYLGTNIVGKWSLPDGRPAFIEAQKLLVSVNRRVSEFESREAKANQSAVPFVTYSASTSSRLARVWTNGHWGEWTANASFARFEIKIYPPRDELDLILNDGKLKTELLHGFRLLPLDTAEFPPPPFADRFPLTRRLAELPVEQRFSALGKFAGAAHAEAQFLLAYAYERGKETPVNLQQALAWYQQSAAQRYAPALFQLARLSLAAETPTPEVAKAAARLKEAAYLGHVPALAMLGSLLVEGRGVPQNRALGIEYLHHAAKKGEPLALFKLAELTFNQGADFLSPARALDYLKWSADKQCAEADYLLGMLCEKGQAMPQNHVEAWKWFSLAGQTARADGDRSLQLRATKALARIRHAMNEDQVEQALKAQLARSISVTTEEDP